MFEIKPVSEADYAQWLELWQGYLAFYETELSQEVTETTFARILASDIQGAIAKDESGRAVGIAHWLTHLDTWSIENACYLEDLFVAENARGAGIGQSLIEHVQRWARSEGITRVYWLTAETNSRARALYDRVAKRTGFIHYEIKD